MRCYYEVLNLPETATNDELKKAYRKLALKCHPDKNRGREDEANEEFKEVCQAYSTLTDPHERAFYDRNKESILRGAGNKEGVKSDDLDVFAYFSTSCFPGGFSDASDGFYATYRNFFDELSLKDMKHMTEEDPTIPTFGHSTTDLEDVAVFYGYWTSYCTSMPFAWADQIDIRQASCRYVEKKIKSENRKFRDQARKQFNEDVRNLVLWVRKRDPRWKQRTRVLEERAAAAESKRAQHQQRQREERRQQLQEDMQDQALSRARQEYLQQLKAMESQMRRGDDAQPSDEDELSDELMGSEDEEVLEDEEDEEDELICVVCIKMFSSERTKELHMKTKKHKQKLAMYLEEERLAATPQENVDEEEEPKEEHTQVDASVVTDAIDGSDNNSDVELQRPQTSINKKEKKRRKQEKKNQKTKLLQQQKEVKLDNKEEDLIDDNQTLEEVNSKVDSLILDERATAEEESNKSVETACNKQEEKQEVSEELNEGHATSKAKTKRKKDKDYKKTTKSNLQPESENFDDEISTLCRICHAEFPSKNKLFQHIKATGHAIIKDMPTNKKKGGAKRK